MNNQVEAFFKFRDDLGCYKHDDIAEKSTVVLKDPVSGKFFYLSEYEYRFLKVFDGKIGIETAIGQLAAAGYYYHPDNAKQILANAAQLGLLLGTKFSSAEAMTSAKNRIKEAKKVSQFSSVYFLFIPLLNPDKFLARTLWIAKLIGNKITLTLLALAAPIAISLIISGLPRIHEEYLFFFSWENLIYLWVTLALTKLIHEFAHAYTAKNYGLHVPQMGVAFLIFFPCLFCNTTDAWSLADRRQRIAISSAGILIEGAMAVISTFVWYFTSPGVINSLAFYLMAISFISTVLFNGNPLMRFDGYFVIMDFLRLPNLSTRSTAYIKYLFYNGVLGLPSASSATTPREVLIFTVYGISSFLYRIFLYCSIVMGVYFRFDKVLGILLGALAMTLFILRPVTKGIRNLWMKRNDFRPRFAGVAAFGVIIAAVIGLALVPISRKSSYPCHMASAKIQKLAVPLETSVDEVFIKEGSKVAAGDLLFTLDATRLQLAVTKKEIEKAILEKEATNFALDDRQRDRAAGKKVELMKLEDEINRIKWDLRLAQQGIVAPFNGIITKLDYKLQKGFQPGEGVIVGELECGTECLVEALIPEKDIEKVKQGQTGKVLFNSGTTHALTGMIEEIKPYSERDLRESPFSSKRGGEIATEPKIGTGAATGTEAEIPLNAQYQCSLLIQDPVKNEIPLGMTGRVILSSTPQGIASRFLERMVSILNKESLF